MKHKIPPIDRKRWFDIPQDSLDLELANVPMISMENATANTILQRTTTFSN